MTMNETVQGSYRRELSLLAQWIRGGFGECEGQSIPEMILALAKDYNKTAETVYVDLLALGVAWK